MMRETCILWAVSWPLEKGKKRALVSLFHSIDLVFCVSGIGSDRRSGLYSSQTAQPRRPKNRWIFEDINTVLSPVSGPDMAREHHVAKLLSRRSDCL